MDLFRFTQGSVPVLVNVPHVGTHVPEAIAGRFTDVGKLLADTDWHLDRLYDFAAGMGVSLLMATHSRYVIDLNRDPSGQALYPGADNTELVPLTTFDREPIYRDGAAPEADEVAQRTATYWRPYHDKLAGELGRLRQAHGHAVLFDAHSIRSHVPRFFEGRLWDLNFGSRHGKTADGELVRRVMAVAETATDYSSVLDGRFTGGYNTAHYGQPANGVHAVQLEMAWSCYMDETPPFAYRPDLADGIRPTLRRLLQAMIDWATD